jgi:hypothetical protein
VLRLASETRGSIPSTKRGNVENLKQGNSMMVRCWWLTPIILATQEAEIGRITIGSQPRQIISLDLISKKPFTKKGWWSGSKS